MRIHTDILTTADIRDAAERAGSAVHADYTRHGSRSRAHAFHIKLTGTSSRRPNNGTGGRFRDGVADSNDEHAATWDEWGMFLAELFRRDPNATIPNVYATSADFDYATDGRFDGLTPELQHGAAGHRWQFSGIPREFECATCDAVKRS